MKTLILITLITLLPGCLFIDSSASTCEDTTTCSDDEVYGEFMGHSTDCYDYDTLLECVDGSCEGRSVECRQSLTFSLTNAGLKTAPISEPTQLEIYSSDRIAYTIELDELRYSTNEQEDGIAAQNPTVKRVLELEPDQSVTLTLFFFMQPNEPVAATAQVTFDIRDQNNLTLTTNIIKFGNPLPPPGSDILEQPQN